MITDGAEILEARCSSTEHSPNAFGRVSWGILKILAPVKKAMLRWDFEHYIESDNYGVGDSRDIFKRWNERARFTAVICDQNTNRPIGEAALDMPLVSNVPPP